ncbi:hypothetical protein CYMTET_56996 [Cymbomonas tetramitiformis]|uniref:Uncharacterized protein n=1 Tax=Cymbomonas tetramitiformis TaxID=36881 RepID=A0AAE0B9R4_9CHLO|nr:hypothetical protein CYMTET_56996 [Cymbomonas tetramitiformis]
MYLPTGLPLCATTRVSASQPVDCHFEPQDAASAGPKSDADVIAAALANAAVGQAQAAMAREKAREKQQRDLEALEAAKKAANKARRQAANLIASNGPSGPEIRTRLVLTTEEAAVGGKHRLSIEVEENCPRCVMKDGFWTLTVDMMNEVKLCSKCQGVTRVVSPKNIEVEVQPGSVDGDEVLVEGGGNSGYAQRLGRFKQTVKEGGEDGNVRVVLVVLTEEGQESAYPEIDCYGNI